VPGTDDQISRRDPSPEPVAAALSMAVIAEQQQNFPAAMT